MTPDPGLLWSQAQEVLRRYLDVTDNLVLIFLSREGVILDCNQGFVKVADAPGKPLDRPVADFFSLPELELLQELPSGFCRKVNLSFRPGPAGLLTLLGYACMLEAGLLIIGERLALSDLDIVGKMSRLHTELLNTAQELSRQKAALDQAQANLKVLQGLLPICSCCKKIRDEQGSWQQIEFYIAARSEADFSHSICPDCAQGLYSDYLTGKPKDREP